MREIERELTGQGGGELLRQNPHQRFQWLHSRKLGKNNNQCEKKQRFSGLISINVAASSFDSGSYQKSNEPAAQYHHHQ
jgi:hypothetical protein